ncbi:MAG: hypothetical protein RDU14_05775 [Melioribacteraceae bacterium]|nr:hypothetical protein [Melioribacteraceae bacterium]
MKGIKSNLTVISILLLLNNFLLAQSEENDLREFIGKVFNDITFSGQWFLSYQSGRFNDVSDNEFLLKRGYITFQKKFSNRFSARITQDVVVDREGDGEGDIEIRLKYGFLRYQFDGGDFFYKPYVEFGLVSRPWIDFEQSINRYRVQGTMFLERNGILSSADYGFSFVSLLGGELDEEYQKNVSKSFPGKYGSIAIGIYNGGGYHAIEKNENKTIDGRLSLRPLPEKIPGLQLSFVCAYGKGNVGTSPDYNTYAGIISFESKPFDITGTYYKGTGFEDGSRLDSSGKPPSNRGYSFFADLNIPNTAFSLIGRYDYFSSELAPVSITSKRFVAGIAYYFLEDSKIIIDYDRIKRNNTINNDDYIFEIAVEFRY